ncbi:PhzF family phenazine biosynthesis protein [Constrictibacter sp. MBR-5]|jgi:PhzF family phenazine biosynthesis protein|uniref:PhzF family phenazine biosynthesis protein n=1 Tax=Constrictibacter sp. MBR-5 TaxID=3156467 RepID=UPI00339A2E7E
MSIPIYQVDAFADRVFGGNPAAVCPLETWLPDAVMQAIAAENNLSETAFFVPRGDDYDLRWFTPGVEVDLCGHATLGSAWVIFNRLAPERSVVRFHTRSGILTVKRDGDSLAMDLPANPAKPCDDAPGLLEALGATPAEVLTTRDHFVAVFPTQAEVRDLAPDFGRMAALDRWAVMVTAPGDDVDFVSRFFAPRKGVPEDPVTGSAHCVLTPFWAARLGRNELTARQISRRGGSLRCRLLGDRVELVGRVAPYLQGTIDI